MRHVQKAGVASGLFLEGQVPTLCRHLAPSEAPSSHWVLSDAVLGLPCVGIRSVFVGMALGALGDVASSGWSS